MDPAQGNRDGKSGGKGQSGDARLGDSDVAHVVRHWLDGGLVALPTETVYGLAGDAGNPAAVAAIFRIKGRPADHPLIVHVAATEDCDYWIDPSAESQFRSRFRLLAQRFWPGPLTMIVPRRPQAPAYACGDQSSIGLRCPSHPIARRLLAAFIAGGGQGIAAPSANRFGRISPTRADHVRSEFGDAGLLVVDGGDAEVGLESTIVDLTRARPVLLRPGAVSVADLQAALGEPVQISSNVSDPSVIDTEAPRASGTLASHYAPLTEMRIVDSGSLENHLASARAVGKRAVALQCAGEAAEYGRQLYARLRELDDGGADLILVEAPPRDARWQAVWDRLLRAQTLEGRGC